MVWRRFSAFFGVAVLVATLSVPFSLLADEVSGRNGVVKSVEPGVLYIMGAQLSIVVVDTMRETANVAVAVSATSPIKVGERITFAGPLVTVDRLSIVDTTKGFAWRPAERNIAEYMADMYNQAQVQAESDAATGIPNAVPVMPVQTAEQRVKEEETKKSTDRDRMLNYILSLLSIIVAAMAMNQIVKLILKPFYWIRLLLRRLHKSPDAST